MSVLEEYNEGILKLYNKIEKNDEFEFDLNKKKDDSINYERYMTLLRYLNKRRQVNKLECREEKIIDFIYSKKDIEGLINYRVTARDDVAKNVMNMKSYTNKRMYRILLKEQKNNELVSIEKKNKGNKENILELDEYNMRLRLSKEEKLTDKEVKEIEEDIIHCDNSDIKIRIKHRTSLIVEDTKDYTIRVDLTKAELKRALNDTTNNTTYELEIEYYQKSDKKENKVLEKVYKEVDIALKVIQNSTYIVKESEKESLIEEYMKLFNHTTQPKTIDSKNVISLEIQNLDKLMNKYAVTDKADGDHSFVYIVNNEAYVIKQNIEIIKTGIKTPKEYNNTVLDGELITIKNKKVVMIFDALFYKGEDIRKEKDLIKRMNKALDVINNCFVKDTKQVIKYSEENEVEKSKEFYKKELKEYFSNLKKEIDKAESKNTLIRLKYFLPCRCGKDEEIFKYSTIYWEQYLTGQHPYNLDGLVYQPLNVEYTYKTNYPDYKWKPADKNSIDFYIEIERDPKTKKQRNVFEDLDNEVEEDGEKSKIATVPYKIIKLMVGQKTNNKEEPVIFSPVNNNPNNDLHIVRLPIDIEGNCKSLDNKIIQDKTVVEFYYNKNEENKYYRWQPIRTRYDKTESVNKYKLKYGNNSVISSSIWDSIIYSIEFEDIKKLGEASTYMETYRQLNNKITDKKDKIDTSNMYYNVNKKMKQVVRPMTIFHNLIKTILIRTYISPEYNNGKRSNVLDVGCGDGGDIKKFFNANYNFVLGLDIDSTDLNKPQGAKDRFKNLAKEGKRGQKPMEFVNSDFTVKLTLEDQLKVIQDKTAYNTNLIKKYFEGNYKFDILNIQFVFHYFLKDEISFNNACENINKTLRNGGYLIITTFDAELLSQVLKDKEEYTQTGIVEGENVILHSIKKKYKDQSMYKLGNTIDIHTSWFMEEGQYRPEYLVDKRFIIDELDKRCNLKLVETKLFSEMYEELGEYIKTMVKIEQKDDMRTHWETAIKYYEDNDINRELLKITKLNRYYVFKKY